MAMIPKQSLSQLICLLGFLLATTLGVTSTRPPDQLDNTNDVTRFDVAVTRPFSSTNWKSTTETAASHKSPQSTPGITMSSSKSPLSSKWNNVNATTSSTIFFSNSTQHRQMLVGTKLPVGHTVPTQATRLTTALAPSINITSVSVATILPTHAPSTTAPTTQTATETTTSASHNTIDALTLAPTKAFSSTPGESLILKHSERNLTIIFSVLLAVAGLVIFLYALDRCKQKKTQYLHRPLYNNSEETVDRFLPADDTLVISGGLYDGPRVYNPTMTTANEDEDFHFDQPPFASRTTHFQLELLREDGEKPPGYEAVTRQTFQPMDADA